MSDHKTKRPATDDIDDRDNKRRRVDTHTIEQLQKEFNEQFVKLQQILDSQNKCAETKRNTAEIEELVKKLRSRYSDKCKELEQQWLRYMCMSYLVKDIGDSITQRQQMLNKDVQKHQNTVHHMMRTNTFNAFIVDMIEESPEKDNLMHMQKLNNDMAAKILQFPNS